MCNYLHVISGYRFFINDNYKWYDSIFFHLDRKKFINNILLQLQQLYPLLVNVMYINPSKHNGTSF